MGLGVCLGLGGRGGVLLFLLASELALGGRFETIPREISSAGLYLLRDGLFWGRLVGTGIFLLPLGSALGGWVLLIRLLLLLTAPRPAESWANFLRPPIERIAGLLVLVVLSLPRPARLSGFRLCRVAEDGVWTLDGALPLAWVLQPLFWENPLRKFCCRICRRGGLGSIFGGLNEKLALGRLIFWALLFREESWWWVRSLNSCSCGGTGTDAWSSSKSGLASWVPGPGSRSSILSTSFLAY